VVTDSWGHDQILMFLGDCAGNLILPGQAFRTGKRPYQRLRSADFNKDGKPDVVTTDLDQNAVSILLGDGKGGLRDAPGSPFPAGKAPWAVAIDDMNHDGNLDLVIVPYAPDVAIRRTSASRFCWAAARADSGRCRARRFLWLDAKVRTA